MQDLAMLQDAGPRQHERFRPLRHEDRIDDKRLERLVHGGLEYLDADEDHGFRLRGHSLNPLVDASSALLGMVGRVRQLEGVEDIERLYRQVTDEIASIEVELTEQGYDRPTLLAYRYVLCSFIDEAVMGTEWGRQSAWAEHSLLTRFHNETWGGEKVFSILARLQQEPQRYYDLLVFIYLCLCLGFEGRYRVMPQGRDAYEQVVRALGEQLVAQSSNLPQTLTDPLDNVVSGRRRRRHELPIWTVFALFGVIMTGVYLGLDGSLGQQASQVSALLDRIHR